MERPSLRPVGTERFRRFDRLGEDYSVEEICERILENITEEDPFPYELRKQYLHFREDHPPYPKAKGLGALYYHFTWPHGPPFSFPSDPSELGRRLP